MIITKSNNTATTASTINVNITINNSYNNTNQRQRRHRLQFFYINANSRRSFPEREFAVLLAVTCLVVLDFKLNCQYRVDMISGFVVRAGNAVPATSDEHAHDGEATQT